MSDEVAVRFANEAFYVAFASRDLDAMEAVWVRNVSVTCIHPGWNPLSGRDAVMDSWAAILNNRNAPDIECRNAKAHVLGDRAYVICHEVLSEAFLVATNIFVRADDGWKMVHHQAGVAPPPDEDDEPERSDTMQ